MPVSIGCSPLSVAVRKLGAMIPIQPASGSSRSAEDLNEQIRRLMSRTGGRLSAAQREEYEVLVVEWAAAVRGEIVEAA